MFELICICLFTGFLTGVLGTIATDPNWRKIYG